MKKVFLFGFVFVFMIVLAAQIGEPPPPCVDELIFANQSDGTVRAVCTDIKNRIEQRIILGGTFGVTQIFPKEKGLITFSRSGRYTQTTFQDKWFRGVLQQASWQLPAGFLSEPFTVRTPWEKETLKIFLSPDGGSRAERLKDEAMKFNCAEIVKIAIYGHELCLDPVFRQIYLARNRLTAGPEYIGLKPVLGGHLAVGLGVYEDTVFILTANTFESSLTTRILGIPQASWGKLFSLRVSPDGTELDIIKILDGLDIENDPLAHAMSVSKNYIYLATGTYFNGQRVSQILRVSHIGTALEIWLPPNDPTFESGSQIGALAIR